MGPRQVVITGEASIGQPGAGSGGQPRAPTNSHLISESSWGSARLLASLGLSFPIHEGGAICQGCPWRGVGELDEDPRVGKRQGAWALQLLECFQSGYAAGARANWTHTAFQHRGDPTLLERGEHQGETLRTIAQA